MVRKIDKTLLKELSNIIEEGQMRAAAQVNSIIIAVYWQIGFKINTHILGNERAEYGKEVVFQVAHQLEQAYGRQFEEKNLRRMMQFATVFPDFEIVVPVARQLSWSHFTILIPIKDDEKRKFYLLKAAEETWSRRELRRQIERKAFERKEIAQFQLAETELEVQASFKDPYFLDFLGLKEGYLENDLEAAILKELEYFILEMGKGFAFVARQKRLIIDGKDFKIDLLFFHRKLKRLVAIDLKLGKFEASHKGQMELYLKWLNKHERQGDEEAPIGLILCAEKSNEQIELLEMGKDGIVVAEYWTELPSKNLLERKLNQLLVEAKARIEHKNLMD